MLTFQTEACRPQARQGPVIVVAKTVGSDGAAIAVGCLALTEALSTHTSLLLL